MDDSRRLPIVNPGASCAANPRALWQLDLESAMRLRWAEGRARYDESRQPIVQAHEALIDCLLYLGVAQAPCAERLAVQDLAERIARQIRGLSVAALEALP